MNQPDASFDDFRQVVTAPDRIEDVARTADVEADWLESILKVSLEEAEYTVRWLGGWLGTGSGAAGRVLEVGAGLGLTSAYLASTGVDVCSIEPGGIGFERYERVNPVLRSSLGITHPHLVMSVEDVTPSDAGTFDLVFSNNVLEHVDDVDATLVALSALLRPGGVMVHNCPNYAVPYEPHFGIPLVPVRPAATARVLPSSITATGLWQSINFVTAHQVRQVAERHGATVAFERGLLADAFDRFGEPEFAARHPALARVSGLLGVVTPALRRLPPSMATPMIVSWRNEPVQPEPA
jgi:2-polyprenyl-3-methyl-5-hydroxy-6-metoxy-1,4-benzoquinol methylase